jgi:hypothetical protein
MDGKATRVRELGSGGAATSAAGEESRVEVGPGLQFVERFGDDAGEALWYAGLALLDQAVKRGQEGAYGRFRHFPGGELRRLRKDLARGLSMCRESCTLQDLVNGELRELTRDLDEQAQEAGRRRRREQTWPAEQARLERRLAE